MSKIMSTIAAGITVAALAVAFMSGDAQARSNKPRPIVPRPIVVVHPYYVRYNPYAPYYYSRWNPYSIYSVYDHLSGGRELCHLPTDPCDNDHRVTN